MQADFRLLTKVMFGAAPLFFSYPLSKICAPFEPTILPPELMEEIVGLLSWPAGMHCP